MHFNRILFNIVASSLLITFFSSCDPQRLYEENKKIDNHAWHQSKPLQFFVSIKDTVSRHNVLINIRHTGNYRFSNLYLFINTFFPQGQIQRDTLECILASPEGEWYGEGLGNIRNYQVLFKRGVIFPQVGEYRFELIQAMRINPLPGITDAGIRIEKAGD